MPCRDFGIGNGMDGAWLARIQICLRCRGVCHVPATFVVNNCVICVNALGKYDSCLCG